MKEEEPTVLLNVEVLEAVYSVCVCVEWVSSSSPVVWVVVEEWKVGKMLL